MRKNLICSALMSTAIFGVLSASAATLTLQQGLNGYTGTRDDADVKDNNSTYKGLDDNLYAYSTIYGNYLGTVVGFNTSAVPANATITSATLQMTFSSGNFGNGASMTWNVKSPSVQWIEGQVDYTFAQNTGSGVEWVASDGNIYQGNNYANSIGISMTNLPTVASASLTGASNTGKTLSFDVTSVVAGWQAGASNNGFAIESDAANANTANFFWAGKADATQAYRPELIINYTVPEPASLSLLSVGATLMLRRRSR